MTVPGNLSSPLLAVAAAGGAATANITKSVRFRSSVGAYLNRTPSSGGDQKTFTLSFWIKRGKDSNIILLCNADSSANNGFYLAIYSNRLFVETYTTSSQWKVETDRLFRDFSAWYHIVVAVDTTQSTASDRVKIYVNGVQETSFNTSNYPSQNYDTLLNNTTFHAIGRAGQNSANAFDGYMADVYLIDGSALDATSFGAFDSNGVWQAAAYSGTFGTNGAHLFDFASESGIGSDSSGNDNDFTVNNLSDGTGPRWFFNGSAGTKITGTIGTALGSGDFTVEMFIEKTTTNHQEALFSFGGLSGTFETDSASKVRYQAGSTYGSTIGTNTRTHIAWVRDNSKGYIYVNGTLVSPSSGISDTTNYTATAFAIGSRPDNGEPFEGYMDNLRVVVGTAVYTSNFTTPSTPLTAVTNTKLLTLTSPTLADTSGQSVSLTNSGVVDEASPGKDILFDVPVNGDQSDTGAGGEVSGNYCTFHPLKKSAGADLSNGNLQVAIGTTGGTQQTFANFAMSSGKWFWEVQSTSGSARFWGIAKDTAALNEQPGGEASSYGWGDFHGTTGEKWHNGSDSAYGTYPSLNDIVGVAFDADNGTLTFYKNGVSQGTAFTGISGTYFPVVGIDNTTHILNAGQRPFAYSAPSGFSPLCTTLLPTPTIADGSTAFDTLLYTGNNTARSITGLSFNPDWVWIKRRNATSAHVLTDSVRGTSKQLFSDRANAEQTSTTAITSFNNDGFSLGTQISGTGDTNASGTYVAWCWDAGTSNASNTDGTITGTVRANIAAGFSIVTYTGNGTNGATVGHGLGTTPSVSIIKNRSTNSRDWIVVHPSLTSGKVLFLNDSAMELTNAGGYQSHGSSTLTFNSGSSGLLGVNHSGDDYVAYCFAPVTGFSAFGMYEGNGSADGTYVNTGFRVAWLMVKVFNDPGHNWYMFDSTRDPDNAVNAWLYPNLTNSEPSFPYVDFLSNGFKFRNSTGSINGNGADMVYFAFAEKPFQANGGLAR